MRKSDLIKGIVEATGLTTADVLPVIDSMVMVIKDQNAKGNEITIRGFGTFGLKYRAEKQGRNIKAGTTVDIPAHYRPYFKPSKEYMDSVKSNVKYVN